MTQTDIESWRDPTRPAEERVADLLGRMTLEWSSRVGTCASVVMVYLSHVSAAAVHETGGNSMVSTPSARAALALAAGLTRSWPARVFFA